MIPATDQNFTEQWNNVSRAKSPGGLTSASPKVKTRWHHNYGFLISANDSTQSRNPEKSFQNQLYLSEERDLFDNRSQASVIKKEKAFNRRRRYVCVGVIIAIVLVLLACIISAVLIEVIFTPPRKDLAVQARLSVRITNRNYTEELSNKSSESFQLFQKEFCSAVQRKVNEDMLCITDSVKNYRNGSLNVDMRLFTTSTTNAEAFAASVIAILKGDRQNETIYWVGEFQISEIKSESSHLVVQDTIPATAIIYNKDELSSNETSSSPLLQELRSTDISPGLLESRSSESSVRTSLSSEFSFSTPQPKSSILESSSTLMSSIMLQPGSSEIPSSGLQPSSNEALSTMLDSRSADVTPSNEKSYSSPQASSAEALSSVLVSSSNEISPITLETRQRETTINTPHTSSKLETSSSEISFSTPQSRSNEEVSSALPPSSNEALYTMLDSSSVDTSPPSKASDSPLHASSDEALPTILVFRSAEISSRSNEASSTMLESSSADTLSDMLESRSSVAPFSGLKSSSNGVTFESSSKLETISIESSFSLLQSRSNEGNSRSTEFSLSTPQPGLNEVLSTFLASSSAVISPIISSRILASSFGETPSNWFESSSIDSFTSSLQTSSTETSYDGLTSISNEFDFGVSVTYYSTLESMPNSVLPNTQLSIPSLSPPYTLQQSSTFGTSAEALTKSLESDFIEINPSAFANESSITTVEPSSSLISTTFEIQTSESSVNVMTTTDTSCMPSVTSTCETSLKLSPSLSPSSTQDIEMSSTLMQGEPVVTFPDQIVEDRLLSKRITCSVDAGIPVSMVTWSVEFQDGRKIENFNFNPTEETNSNNHVSSFISIFNISWHNSRLCCNVDQGNRKTSSCKHLFVVPSGYCNNRTDRLYDHPYDDCYLYVSCGFGIVYISSCAKGGPYCFDEQSQSCSRVAPSDVYSCNGKRNNAYIPVRNSCQKYTWCVNGVGYEYACDGASYFFDTDPDHVCTNDINRAYCTLHDNK